MKIACIAWGSLLWKAGPLPVASDWMADGPPLPLEFCRVGDGGELALTLAHGAALMQSRWAWLEVDDLETARELLRQREQITPQRPEWIGSVPVLHATPHDLAIGQWMHGRNIDAVVWTALPPRSGGVEGRMPTLEQVLDYLDGLSGDVRAHARDYVQRTPTDIATPFREAIENRLGWLAHEAVV